MTVDTSVAAPGTKVPRRGFVEIYEAKQTETDPLLQLYGLRETSRAMESSKLPTVDDTADATTDDRLNDPALTTTVNNPDDIVPTTALEHFLITLAESLTTLAHKTNDLLSRYKAAGAKYHSMPFAALNSTHLEVAMISLLAEVYIATPDGRLASCVAHPFADLVCCIVEAKWALEGDELDLRANGRFMRDAAEYVEDLETWMCAIEVAVEGLVAVRHLLGEQGLVVLSGLQVVAQDQQYGEWKMALDRCEAEVKGMNE